MCGASRKRHTAHPQKKNPGAIAGVFRQTPLLLNADATHATKTSALPAITVGRICGARRGIGRRHASYERQASPRSATGLSKSCRLYDRTSVPRPACTAQARQDRWPSRQSRKTRPTARSTGMRKPLASSSIVPRRFLGRALHNGYMTKRPAFLCDAKIIVKPLQLHIN